MKGKICYVSVVFFVHLDESEPDNKLRQESHNLIDSILDEILERHNIASEISKVTIKRGQK